MIAEYFLFFLAARVDFMFSRHWFFKLVAIAVGALASVFLFIGTKPLLVIGCYLCYSVYKLFSKN
jgi:hypothetical protein